MYNSPNVYVCMRNVSIIILQEVIRAPHRDIPSPPSLPASSSSSLKKQQQQQRPRSPSPTKRQEGSEKNKNKRVKSIRVKYTTTGSAAVRPSRRREQRRASSSTDAAELGHRHNEAQAIDSPVRRRARVISFKASRPSSKHFSPLSTATRKTTNKSSKSAKNSAATPSKQQHQGATACHEGSRQYKTVTDIKESDAWLLL